MNDMLDPRRTPDDRHASMVSVAERPAQEKWRRTAALLTLIAVGGPVLVGLAHHAARDAAASDALRSREAAVPVVRTAIATTVDAPRDIAVPATLEADAQVEIRARATGYVLRRNVDIGSSFHKGDVLAVVSSPELDRQLDEARARSEAAQAEVTQAAADAALARVTDTRTASLAAQGWSSRQQGDDARLTLASRRARLAAATSALAEARANVNRLEKLRGFEEIVAPFDGIVTARHVDQGSLVTADASGATPLFDVARTDLLRAVIDVPQSAVAGVRNGTKIALSFSGIEGVFDGRITRNADSLVEQTRTLRAEIDIANPDGKLLPGLYGTATLSIAPARPYVRLPSQAVMFGENGLTAAVLENGHASIRPLEVAQDDGATLEIRHGLARGDRIVLDPPAGLAPGAPLREAGGNLDKNR